MWAGIFIFLLGVGLIGGAGVRMGSHRAGEWPPPPKEAPGLLAAGAAMVVVGVLQVLHSRRERQ